MMRLNKRELVIFGIGFGILVFFFGIGLGFLLGPTTETHLLPKQVSSIFKYSGMGITVISMIVGGFFVEKMEKDIKALLLIFGIILLLINILIMSIPGT